MGQYHIIANLDKHEIINPHVLASGLKIWEQLDSGMTGRAMLLLMTCPEARGGGDLEEGYPVGHWHGDRVVVVGDYAEDDDFVVPNGELKPSQIYIADSDHGWKNISLDVAAALERELDGRFSGGGWRDWKYNKKENQ
jgi:hypothetical protein